MKSAEAIFMLHGDVNRKSTLLNLLNDNVYVVIWPGTNHEDAVRNLVGYDPAKHTLLEIGNRDKLYIGRNNIIDYCHEHNIDRFWMLDDDIITFRLGGPSQEFKDRVFQNGRYTLKNIEFEDDTGLGGLTMSGVMFNKAIDKPMFSHRFIWAAIFLDLSINPVRYSLEGYDDIDMQLECVKRGIKHQTVSWLGQTKPQWLTKKSLNSQVDKINYNNYLVYKKWGDTVKIDVYYDKQKNKYFRVHVKYPYKIKDLSETLFRTDSLESFVQSLEDNYRDHPELFKVCGLPHMKTENKKPQ